MEDHNSEQLIPKTKSYRALLVTLIVLLFAGLATWVVLGVHNPTESGLSKEPDTIVPTTDPQTDDTTDSFTFANPKKSAHYESNTPAHGAVLEASPVNVVIDFNFDLAKPSEIKILKDGQDYGVGETKIDSNKLAIRRTFQTGAPDGLYTVSYNACWPDGSCHDGSFQFAINRNDVGKATDLRNKSEIEIDLADVMFKPEIIRISPGTKVIWTNSDDVEHYINTDSHPAHTYFPSQNSRVLKKGDSYSVAFTSPGVYPYHCSAHADTMTGRIIVH